MQQRLHESMENGYPKLISLKPWSQQNPILFLNIQASSEIVWFEMLRASHRTQISSSKIEP